MDINRKKIHWQFSFQGQLLEAQERKQEQSRRGRQQWNARMKSEQQKGALKALEKVVKLLEGSGTKAQALATLRIQVEALKNEIKRNQKK